MYTRRRLCQNARVIAVLAAAVCSLAIGLALTSRQRRRPSNLASRSIITGPLRMSTTAAALLRELCSIFGRRRGGRAQTTAELSRLPAVSAPALGRGLAGGRWRGSRRGLIVRCRGCGSRRYRLSCPSAAAAAPCSARRRSLS
jgi:hypothetical protein